ncbi:GNAT family N-acetyltransferase [soil metagenome]
MNALILREWTAEDLDIFSDIHAHPEVAKYIGPGRPRTREESLARMHLTLNHYEAHGFGMWAADSRESGQMIGRCGLQPLGDDIEIGWTFAREAWGRGYATEAARAVLEFAFQHASLERIVAVAVKENTASINIMWKLGMTFDSFVEIGGRDAVKYVVSPKRPVPLSVGKHPI